MLRASIISHRFGICKLVHVFSQTKYRFDFGVVLGTDVGLLLRFLTSASMIATTVTIIRAFRIMRIVRLIKTSKILRVIM